MDEVTYRMETINQVYEGMDIYNALYIHPPDADLESLRLALLDDMYSVIDSTDLLECPDDAYHKVILVPSHLYTPELMEFLNITVAFVHDVRTFTHLVSSYNQFELPWIISLSG